VITIEQLARELDNRWDSNYPTVLGIVKNYARIFDHGGLTVSDSLLTETCADKIRAAYDKAEFAAGRTPMPGTDRNDQHLTKEGK